MPGLRASRSCWIGVLLTLTSGFAHAQAPSGRLRGLVRDSAGQPVDGAQVSVPVLGLSTRTDADGRFLLIDLPKGPIELSIRHLGFGLQRVSTTMTGVAIDTVLITLVDQVTELDGVDVTAKRHPFMIDFESRRARGVGTFVTRADIDARHTSSPSDLFRQVPTVRLIRVNTGMGIRFPSSGQMRGRSGGLCVPMIWVDGQKAPGMEIDDLRSSDIEAIELYRGAATTPAAFAAAGNAQCGAVVVWTRRR